MSGDVVELFRTLSCGVYVIGVAHAGRRNGFTAAWVVQASFRPLLMVLSINPHNASYALLRGGSAFTVNVLRHGQLDLARHFGTLTGGTEDKLGGVDWRPSASGAPILTAALAYFDCRLSAICEAGDHDLVIGRVVDGGIMMPRGVPMHYSETEDMDGSSALYPSFLPERERRDR